MLLGAAAKYGKNSGEYGKAGGVPKSERRRPTKKRSSGEPLQPLVITALSNGKATESVNGNGNGTVPVSQ